MIRGVLVGALLACALPVHAQVYKCVENGRTVFSDIPCPDAEQVPIFNSEPTAEDAEAARTRLERIQADAERERARRDAQREAGQRAAMARREAEKSAAKRRCDEILKEKRDADHWAREFRHPDNIAKAKAESEHWKDRLWWECKKIDQ